MFYLFLQITALAQFWFPSHSLNFDVNKLNVYTISILCITPSYNLRFLNEKSGKTIEVPFVTGTGICLGSSLQIHFISLCQIHNGAETGTAISSVRCGHDTFTVSHQVCSNQLVITVEICIELVGSVLRGDEFAVICVADVTFIERFVHSFICLKSHEPMSLFSVGMLD